MKVKFFAYLRDTDYTGCKEIEISGCSDLHMLGEKLTEMYGRTLHDFYFSEDESDFGENAIVLVNGRRAGFLDGMQTQLSESDTVLIFPVVAGG